MRGGAGLVTRRHTLSKRGGNRRGLAGDRCPAGDVGANGAASLPTHQQTLDSFQQFGFVEAIGGACCRRPLNSAGSDNRRLDAIAASTAQAASASAGIIGSGPPDGWRTNRGT
jgi:hypothetical protein